MRMFTQDTLHVGMSSGHLVQKVVKFTVLSVLLLVITEEEEAEQLSYLESHHVHYL